MLSSDARTCKFCTSAIPEAVRSDAQYCGILCRRRANKNKNKAAALEYTKRYRKTYTAPLRLASEPCKCGCGEHPRLGRIFVKGHYKVLEQRPVDESKRIASVRASSRKADKRKLELRYSSNALYLVSLMKRARRRARREGTIWEDSLLKHLSTEPPTACGCCGGELDYSRAFRGVIGNLSPSLDRVHPKTGYVPGNVVVVCVHCNTLKGFGSESDHRRIADYIRRQTSEGDSCQLTNS